MNTLMKTTPSMSGVLAQFLPAYKTCYSLSPEQSKALGSIRCCRTEALGGRSLVCDHCDYQRTQFHSCRNRHCPQCQHSASLQWREKRCEEILPVPYFHLVFTLPHELNGWAQLHRKVIYGLLFKAVWHTLRSFGEDKKYLDGRLGMTAVLHTWGQNLGQHIHLHCLVPGGALSHDGQHWHRATSEYLFPIRALSRCFRGKMVSLLRAAWKDKSLHRITSAEQVDEVLGELMKKDWVVYARHTCEHTTSVVNYLSQYTHRIAISDKRVVAIDQEQVRFRWKDYADDSKNKTMSLSGVEFIRRFLMHILPTGFMRVRHYGFLANCHRKAKLLIIRQCLEIEADTKQIPCQIRTIKEPLSLQKDIVAGACPKCRAMMRVVAEVKRVRRR